VSTAAGCVTKVVAVSHLAGDAGAVWKIAGLPGRGQPIMDSMFWHAALLLPVLAGGRSTAAPVRTGERR
jgi:hypothetical protein